MIVKLEIYIPDDILIQVMKNPRIIIDEDTADEVLEKIKTKVVTDVRKTCIDVFKQICEKNDIKLSIPGN